MIQIEGVGDGTEKANHVFSFEKLALSYNDSEEEDEPSDESSDESSITITNLDHEADNYSFSWKALSHFEKSLRAPSHAIQDWFLEQYNGHITTGDLALPEILDRIYIEFFGMYNIIEHNKPELDYNSKRYLVFLTVAVLHQMLTIKVVDVTRDTIQRWFEFIGFIEKRGKFNVGFVAENMKQVWRAHYYIQAKKIVDDETSRLERELEQVSMYEAELRTKLDGAKARHHELKLMAQEHDQYTIIGARGLMKKARSDALEIKWRSCYESLVTHPGNAPAK